MGDQLVKFSMLKFASPLFNLRKFTQPTKVPPGTRVPFCKFIFHFCSLGINLRIPGNLQKCQSSFKSIFKPLISSIFISHSHSKLRKNPIKLRSPKFQSISSIGSLEIMCLKRKHLCAPNTYPMEHKPSNSSLFQPWPRQEEPMLHLHQLAIQGQEFHLHGIPHLRPHKPLPFHFLRVECPLTLLNAGMRRGDHPLHLGQALRAPRDQFIVLLQRKPKFQAQEPHLHLHNLIRLL